MNLSFAGCGFLGIYHVGVACCFRKYAPHLLLNKISGASAGAIAACCLLCDFPLGDITSDVLRVATEVRNKSLGPFTPSVNINSLLLEGLEKFLPEDAHIRVSGKLHISLTRVYDGKNVIVSQFDSREELIQALLASAFIPIFSGIIPPKFKGVRYMDGGYSDNLPMLDENTITVSPFCGESDICPRDDSSQLFHINLANTSIELSKHNIYRMVRILFPPKTEILSNMCKQGFDDALRFLSKNNLINCTRCLAVQSTFIVSERPEDNVEYDPQCKECKLQRQEALVSNMPDTVLSIFQEYIDSANKGLLNWIFKHRGMKLLSVLTLPYTIPVDIMYATFTKLTMIPQVKAGKQTLIRSMTSFDLKCAVGRTFDVRYFQYKLMESNTLHNHLVRQRRLMAAAPQVGNGVWEVSRYCMNQMSSILNKVNKKGQQLSAKISCQLAITEYGNHDDVEACQEESTQNKMNLNFTFNLEDNELPLVANPERKFSTSKVLQRTPSFVVSHSETDPDTFDHILKVTSQHETIMTYYYMDENNKLKVTEIFDVTDSDSPLVQTSHERDLNEKLEFDDEYGETTWNAGFRDDISDYSVEDLHLDKDNSNISDPESEWIGTFKIEEPEDTICSSDLMPESDQAEHERTIPACKTNYQIPSFWADPSI